LGYDLDTLEVRFHELADTVDLFAIIESRRSHKGLMKPLLWDRNKNKERFKPFQDKVLHVIASDERQERRGNLRGTDWTWERKQENDGVKQVRSHLDSLKISHDREVTLVFGDTDEVPKRENVWKLKVCQPRSLPIENRLLFPMGLLGRSFGYDAWVDPVFQSPTAFRGRNGDGRSQGHAFRSRNQVVNMILDGGLHMSWYKYLPFMLNKMITCTECDGLEEPWVRRLMAGNIRKLHRDSQALEMDPHTIDNWKSRLIKTERLRDQSFVYTPWYLKCNRKRFGTWYGEVDKRYFTPIDCPVCFSAKPRSH